MILVTGGTGLLGSHLLYELVREHEEVVALKPSHVVFETSAGSMKNDLAIADLVKERTGAEIIFELDSNASTLALLQAGGWTLLTAVNMMLFSLVHNPCSTTIYTIYKETGSKKWTSVATIMPVVLGVLITFFVAQIWRVVAGIL